MKFVPCIETVLREGTDAQKELLQKVRSGEIPLVMLCRSCDVTVPIDDKAMLDDDSWDIYCEACVVAKEGRN